MTLQQEIDDNNSRFCAALARHDMDALLQFYTDDIMLLIPGAPPINGKDELNAYYEGVFGAGVNAATMKTLRLEQSGEDVIEVGEYSMTLAPADTESFTDTGKYFVIHRRQSTGALAMAIDMFHSDTPTT